MRKAVIIAAGNGSRLRQSDEDLPKPLIKVAGAPLIERVIVTAKKAGVSSFVVVLGFKGEEIQRHLVSVQSRLGVSIEFVWNDDWKKPNGFSVLKAESLVDDEFYLMMSDHIFETPILEDFFRQSVLPGEVVLATDGRMDEVFDLEDATKVLATDGKIQAIGKQLPTYNAVDTGLFLCSSALFEALRVACQEGNGSLSEAIQILAAQGKARVEPIAPYFWQDVDSPSTLVHAERRLFQLLARAKPTDGVVSRNFNRKVSGWITRWLIKTPVTANQVSYSALILGLISALLVSKGDYLSVALGGLLFQFCSIFDGCDGEVAKLRMTSTKFGEWLDTLCDNVTYVAFFSGALVGLYRQGASPLMLTVGYLSIAGVLLTLGLMYLYLRRHSNSGSLVAIQIDLTQDLKGLRSLPSRFISKVKPLAKRDCFALVFMFFALCNRLDWIVIGTFAGSQVMWIVMLTMRKNLSYALTPAHGLQED